MAYLVVVKFEVAWLCDLMLRTLTVFAIPGSWIPVLPAGMTWSGPADFTT